jgi:hypothetical protein
MNHPHMVRESIGARLGDAEVTEWTFTTPYTAGEFYCALLDLWAVSERREPVLIELYAEAEDGESWERRMHKQYQLRVLGAE